MITGKLCFLWFFKKYFLNDFIFINTKYLNRITFNYHRKFYLYFAKALLETHKTTFNKVGRQLWPKARNHFSVWLAFTTGWYPLSANVNNTLLIVVVAEADIIIIPIQIIIIVIIRYKTILAVCFLICCNIIKTLAFKSLVFLIHRRTRGEKRK